MLSAVGLAIAGGFVLSGSLVLLAAPVEEDDEVDGSAIAMDVLFTSPVIEARRAAVPSSIAAVLFVFVIERGRGTRGFVFSILSGSRAGGWRGSRGGLGF
jgi:hypothetical protein